MSPRVQLDDDMPDLEDRLLDGTFILDRAVELSSGAKVRLRIEASMLVTSDDDMAFIMKLIAELRGYEARRGVDLADGTG